MRDFWTTSLADTPWKLSMASCFVMVLSMATLHAQPSLSREQAVAKALEQNLGIQLAKYQVEMASIGNTWGAAGALPSVGINASVAGSVIDQSENPTSFIQDKIESQSLSTGAQLNWVVFDGLGMFANKQALEKLVEQADGQAVLMIEQTVAATILTYDNVLVQQGLLKTLEASMDASRTRLEWMDLKREMGVNSEFDRLQFANALISDSLAWIQQQLNLDMALRSLNRLMGEGSGATWKLLSAIEIPQDVDAQALSSELLTNSRVIQNALIAEELARINMEQARSRMSPTLQLGLTQGDQRSQLAAGDFEGEGRSTNWSTNLIFNFNLFNGGATRRAIEQAKVQIIMAENRSQDEIQEAERLFSDAMGSWLTAKDAFRLSQVLVENAKSSLLLAEERVALGAMNSIDFRNVQLQLLRSEQESLRMLQVWLNADVELRRLVGDLVKE